MHTIKDLLYLKTRLELGDLNPDDLLFFYQSGSISVINCSTDEELLFFEDFAREIGLWLEVQVERM